MHPVTAAVTERIEARSRDTRAEDLARMEAARPADAQHAIPEIDADGGAELLHEADLLVQEDDEAELDESDLIQT